MRERDTPITVPDSPIYISVDLPDRERHHFRIPSPAAGVMLLREIPVSALSSFAALAEGAGTTSELFAAAKSVGPELLAAFAYFIGRGWFHEYRELSAVWAGDVQAYADAVHEEMYEDGYTLDEQMRLGAAVLTAWVSRNMLQAEAEDKARFFSQPTAGTS